MGEGDAETAGALGRAEERGAAWAGQAEEEAEDGRGEGKVKEQAGLRLTDVDLRGLEFSKEVAALSCAFTPSLASALSRTLALSLLLFPERSRLSGYAPTHWTSATARASSIPPPWLRNHLSNVRACAFMRTCVCACVCVRVRACVSLCVCVCAGLPVRQRTEEVARAVALGTCSGGVTRISGLALADKDGANLNETVTRRPRKEGGKDEMKQGGGAGEKAPGGEKMQGAEEVGEAAVKGLDAVDWGFVAGRAAWYKWGRLDLRCGAGWGRETGGIGT